MQTLPCVAVNTDGRVLTGTWRGELYVWQHEGGLLWRRLEAHSGALQSVSICTEQVDGCGFATGGADGLVLLWAASYLPMRRIDLNSLLKRGPLDACGRPCLLPPPRGVHVRSVCWDAAERRVLVGTGGNEVVRIQLLDDGGESATLITQGHHGGRMRNAQGIEPAETGAAGAIAASASVEGGVGEAWRALRALAEHPQLPQFASGGDDGAIKLWSLAPHRLISARRLRASPCCLAYSPDGLHLAAGCSDGSLFVLLSSDLSAHREVPAPTSTASLGPSSSSAPTSSASSSSAAALGPSSAAAATASAATALAYSPDGRLLAVGFAHRLIRLHQVPSADGSSARSYRPIRACRGHTGAITHLGWSLDSSCLQSNCECLELRFWDADGAEVAAGDRRITSLGWASGSGGVLYARETAGVHTSPSGEDARVSPRPQPRQRRPAARVWR